MNRLIAAGVACGVFSTPLCSDLAFADGRVALVIGNSAYQNAPALPNPKRDAQAIAATLKKGGYHVVSANDVGNLQFKRTVRQFEDAAANAEIAVVFYAGHGIEIGGINYMIPVDAKLASDRDAEDEAISLDRIVGSVEGAKQLGLVILDACRNNPFIPKMKRPRTAAMRAVTAGLALVEPTTRNTLIAYAAKAGFAAEDGDREHSPFTESLLKHLFEPGRDIRFAFGYIRDEVYESTGHRQEPYVSGSLGGAHISIVPAPEQATTPVVDEKAQRDDFTLVDKLTDGAAPADAIRVWDAYLAQHTNGLYHELARQRRAKLALVVHENAPTALPNPADGPRLAAIDPGKPPSPPSPSSEEQRAWDRIKDSSNPAAFRDFIRRYPSSVLANTAQTRLQALERAAQEQAAEEARQKAEREAKARAEREAKAAEEARQKAEREAAVGRAEEERLAKLAEAARAAAAEAARQRQEAERKKAEQEAARQRSEAAEAERKRLEQEAARKRAEAAEAEGQKAEQDRARKLAEAAEAERKKLEQEAAHERAEKERRAAELERQKAEREAAIKRAEEERLAKQAEAERQRAERLAALQRAEEEQARKQQEETERASREATCRREADRLAELRSTRDQSKAREGLKRLQEELICERLRPSVTAALKKIEKPEPEELGPGRHRQRATPEESRKSAARHRNEEAKPSRQRTEEAKPSRQRTEEAKPSRQQAEEAKPSRQRAKREESRPQPRVRLEARTAPVRHFGGGGGGSMVGVGF